MALVSTTLSVAVAALDKEVQVASATSITAGRVLRIDNEVMQVAKNYSSGTVVPVLRGRDGTEQVAHVITAQVVHGDSSDFGRAAGTTTTYPASRPWRRVSYTGAANTLVLPKPGENLHVFLNGTTADTFTVPVPTVDITGSRLLISSNGVAQHVLTFTGGLSGAGSSYDVVTINATAPASFEFVAVDGLWHSICGAAISGTTTAIAGVLD